MYSLKSFFDKWVYASVYALAKEARPHKEEQPINVTGSTFIEMVQGMVGGGINASRVTHCPSKIKSGPIHEVFQMLVFKDDGPTVHSPEYAPYYPAGLQFRNMGALHLVPPKFIPWAIELMKFIMTCYDDEKVILNRGEFIVVSMQKLRNDSAYFDTFACVF